MGCKDKVLEEVNRDWVNLKLCRNLPNTFDPKLERSLSDNQVKEWWANNYVKMLKHTMQLHEGEIAMMGGSWNGARGSPPTELVESSAKLQHIQFSFEQAGWMNGGALQPAVGGEALRNRVFAFAEQEDEDADYYVREGPCISLPMLFLAGMRKFSAFDLYSYYDSLELIAVKRPHPESSGSKQSRVARHKRH